MLSIIIPSFKDPFLQKTIDSLIENARGDIEIIPILDGYPPEIPLKKNKIVRPIIFAKNLGMRGAINSGLKAAKGNYIMKCDSHCSFGPGFDKIMSENCRENWLLIPSRYSLDDESWSRRGGRAVANYHYLSFPADTDKYGVCLSPRDRWHKRESERKASKYDIDDTMTFQGSCWFANKKYFMKQVGFLDDRRQTYGPFADEPLEIGLKYWLGGGENKVIKKTWYAHLSKRLHHYRSGIFDRSYKVSPETAQNHTWSAKHWLNNKEPGMVHPFSWLVEKFWPVPTWPEDRLLWQTNIKTRSLHWDNNKCSV